jgi:hypothetical protein
MLGKLCSLVACFLIIILFATSSCCDRPRAICSHACRVCLVIVEMVDINEQGINIKFYFKLWKTFTDTHEVMNAFMVISS